MLEGEASEVLPSEKQGGQKTCSLWGGGGDKKFGVVYHSFIMGA